MSRRTIILAALAAALLCGGACLRPDRGAVTTTAAESRPGPQALAPTDTAPKAEAAAGVGEAGQAPQAAGAGAKPVEGDVRLSGLRGGPLVGLADNRPETLT